MDPGFYDGDYSSYQAGRTWMDVVYTSGASGAIPSPLGAVNYGLKSLAYSGTGILTAVFNQQAHGLLNFHADVQQATYSKTGACFVKRTGYNAATKTVTMLIVDAAGDAVASASGDIICLTFEWQRYGNS